MQTWSLIFLLITSREYNQNSLRSSAWANKFENIRQKFSTEEIHFNIIYGFNDYQNILK